MMIRKITKKPRSFLNILSSKRFPGQLSWGLLAGFLLLAISSGLASRAQEAPSGDIASTQKDSDVFRQLSLFGDVLDLVNEDYVKTIDESKLIEAAINGMLSSLDPHSSYLSPNNFEDVQVQTKGEFGGLGIEVTMENGLVKVVSPIDDTPAHRAGIQPGDFITHLDGTPILGMSLGEAVEKMRGEAGTDILLTIRRKDEETLEIPITRAVIRIQSVRSQLEEDIGYIRITTFNEQAYSGLKEAVSDLEKEADGNLKGIILDLRNNPGGLLEQAVNVSDAFLERGEIVSTRGRDESNAQRFNARSGDITGGLPMVILINGGSASASEIVAGALQDHRRAIIMGMPSFGKGSVQTIIPMGARGAVRLTTALYYTPSGRSIQAKGIDPDIQIEDARIEAIDNGKQRKEADLRGALNNETDDDSSVLEDKVDPASGEEDQTSKHQEEDNKFPRNDYQLSRAFDLLRGIAILDEKTAILGPVGIRKTN